MLLTAAAGVELAIGFVLSYVANNIPTLKEWLEGDPDINDRLESCYRQAVDKWNVELAEKDAYKRGGMQRHLDELKEYVLNPQKGRHHKENEFLGIWANYIYADPACAEFINQHKEDIHNAETLKAILSATELIEELKAYEQEAFNKLSEDLQTLINRGADTCERFWERKFTAKEGRVPYEIVLGGRDEARKAVEKVLSTNNVVCVRAETKLEAIAFVVAVIMTSKQEKTRPAIILQDIQLYGEMAGKKCSDIIITTQLDDSPWWAQSNGHSVIICLGKNDKQKDISPIVLPAIKPKYFEQALVQAGFSDTQARHIAKESSYDIASLCRVLNTAGINDEWKKADNKNLLIPAILVGSWDEAFENDKELVSQIVGLAYNLFKVRFLTNVAAEESPFIVVGTEWRLKSPRTMMETYKADITIEDVDKFIDKINWLFEDDDPDAEAKMNAKEMQYWKNKNAYSGSIKEGAFHTLALLSLVFEDNIEIKNKIKNLVRTKLQDFDLARFLSNQHNMKWIAEAEPEMFLEFLENDIREGDTISSQLFEIKESKAELTDTRIFYTDLLWCLESIAWDEQLLPRVTAILLHYCQYPNTSNWENRPINSLFNIYRFAISQTFASFEQRYEILEALSANYKPYIYALCMQMLRGLDRPMLDVGARFTWRWNERYDDNMVTKPTYGQMAQIVDLALRNCEWSKEEIKNWLKLSVMQLFGFRRERILEEIKQHLELMNGDDDIIHTLRNDIIERHLSCQDTFWALKESELEPYQALLDEIVPTDVISRNKHYFENFFLRDPLDNDPKNHLDYAKKKRAEVLQKIVDAAGEAGIWELAAKAKSQEAVASGLVAYGKDKYVQDVYERYVNGTVSEGLTSAYFRELYYLFGESRYLEIINQLSKVNRERIVIVLQAPAFHRNLAKLAEQLSTEQATEYWQKVQIWQIEEADASYVLDRMRKVKRYGDILQNLFAFNKQISFPESERVAVICEMYHNGALQTMMRDAYHVAEVLKTISWPQEQPQKNIILQIEFLMYEHMEHYMHGFSMHLVRELNENPEVLFSIVTMMYLQDEGYRDELKEEEMEFRKNLARVGWSFMYHYHQVPCSDEKGNVDGEELRKYLERLRELMIENHYETVIPLVFGKILGDMPEDDDYPSDVMCQLVEELNDKHVDDEIGCAIFNRRGMSTRMPYDGGTIERNHIKTLEKYKERAALRSPRMVKILSDTIASFESMAKREDEQAERQKLMI